MSEVNPEQLVENVSFTVQDNRAVPMPIDPTLSNEGEAADAKAVGDAIAALVAVKKVNNQNPDNAGNVTLLATQIPMSGETGAQTISEAISAAQGATAESIRRTSENTQTVEEGIAAIETAITNGCTEEEIDALFEEDEEE